jgi:four helix bundle protein
MSGFIPAHGGYEDLLSFRKARIVYDGTVRFCERFLDKRDRTVDQMVQAARSGKQNILEGCMASATSKETEIKLVNVARASLEELLEDYRDFLRTRGQPTWEKDSREALFVRKLGQKTMCRMRPIGPILTPAPATLSPTSWFASSIKPTTSWTSKSGLWKRPFSPKVACASA